MIAFFNYNSYERQSYNIEVALKYFNREKMIFFDNGSGERSKEIKNIFLLENKGFQKGFSTLSDYFIENSSEEILTVTNASILLNHNLYEYVRSSTGIKNLAYASPAYYGEHVTKTKHPQMHKTGSRELKYIKNNQTMMCSYSKSFLTALKANCMGPYNGELEFGWGWDIEMAVLADYLRMNHGFFPNVGFEWTRNYTAKKTGTVESYHSEAGKSVEKWLAKFTQADRYMLKLYLNSPHFLRIYFAEHLFNILRSNKSDVL